MIKVKYISDVYPNLVFGEIYEAILQYVNDALSFYIITDSDGRSGNYYSNKFEVIKENEYEVVLL